MQSRLLPLRNTEAKAHQANARCSLSDSGCCICVGKPQGTSPRTMSDERLRFSENSTVVNPRYHPLRTRRRTHGHHDEYILGTQQYNRPSLLSSIIPLCDHLQHATLNWATRLPKDPRAGLRAIVLQEDRQHLSRLEQSSKHPVIDRLAQAGLYSNFPFVFDGPLAQKG